jgi:hypothetical protein
MVMGNCHLYGQYSELAEMPRVVTVCLMALRKLLAHERSPSDECLFSRNPIFDHNPLGSFIKKVVSGAQH